MSTNAESGCGRGEK